MAGSGWLSGVLVAGAAAVATLPSQLATGAVSDAAIGPLADVTAEVGSLPAGGASLEIRYVQEDGPGSGHVRVVLTPELRPLSMLEARSAAQDAFLKALREPGLGDALSIITVVVRLMPASHPDPVATEQVIRYVHTGGRQWSILPSD